MADPADHGSARPPVERRLGNDRAGRRMRSVVLHSVRGFLRLTGARIRTFGEPPAPGCVVAFHHNSPIDALVIGLQGWEREHHPIAMVHAGIFRAPVIGRIVTTAGMVPVQRGDRHDRKAAYDHSCRQVEAGHTMFIAPESGISRSFTLQNLRHGATRLAMDTGVPLVPCVTFGTQRFGGSHGQGFRPRRGIPIDVWWGEPIEVSDLEDTTARLQSALGDLLDRALEAYPEPGVGKWWWPHHLGGTAPDAEQAAADRKRRRGDA